MARTISVFDETWSSAPPREPLGEGHRLALPDLTITARQLIALHVEASLQAHSEQRAGDAPTKTEADIGRALEAFAAGAILLFVGDDQIDGLDAEIDFSEADSARFVRLTPLKGG